MGGAERGDVSDKNEKGGDRPARGKSRGDVNESGDGPYHQGFHMVFRRREWRKFQIRIYCKRVTPKGIGRTLEGWVE